MRLLGPRGGQQPQAAGARRALVANSIEHHGDQPGLRRIRHRAAPRQAHERLLYHVVGQLRVAAQPVREAEQARVVGVEDLHESVVERRWRRLALL
jgi:hypothetical protein